VILYLCFQIRDTDIHVVIFTLNELWMREVYFPQCVSFYDIDLMTLMNLKQSQTHKYIGITR